LEKKYKFNGLNYPPLIVSSGVAGRAEGIQAVTASTTVEALYKSL
jgi:hypothetical protein